jgi:hypothetical protein
MTAARADQPDSRARLYGEGNIVYGQNSVSTAPACPIALGNVLDAKSGY